MLNFMKFEGQCNFFNLFFNTILDISHVPYHWTADNARPQLDVTLPSAITDWHGTRKWAKKTNQYRTYHQKGGTFRHCPLLCLNIGVGWRRRRRRSSRRSGYPSRRHSASVVSRLTTTTKTRDETQTYNPQADQPAWWMQHLNSKSPVQLHTRHVGANFTPLSTRNPCKLIRDSCTPWQTPRPGTKDKTGSSDRRREESARDWG